MYALISLGNIPAPENGIAISWGLIYVLLSGIEGESYMLNICSTIELNSKNRTLHFLLVLILSFPPNFKPLKTHGEQSDLNRNATIIV
jgi:hypothetical protein